MAKDIEISLNAKNLIRNANRAAEELDKIVNSMKSITSASASMSAKTKEMEGRLQGVTKAGNKFSASFSKTKTTLKLVSIAIKNTTGNIITLRKETQKLAQIQVAGEKLQGLVAGGQKLQAAKEELRIRSKLTRIEIAAQRLQKSFDYTKRTRAATAEVAAREKLARIMAHVARIEAPLKLAATTKKANNVAKELHINWTSIVRLLSAQLIYRAVFGLAQQLREAFTNAVELQVAIAEIRTIAPPTESFQDFAIVLRRVSDRFGVDIIESAEAAYQALSNQVVDTAVELERFLTVTNLLAIATRSTADDAVNLLTGVLNAYRLEVSDAADISAKLFKIVELGRVRANEMANSLGNVAILANQVGFSFDELGGLITTLTVQGIRFSEAQTQIRGILIKLIKPTKAMTEFLNELGFESGEAAIKALGLVGFLEQMSRKTGDSTTEIAKLINRVRGLSGALAVTGKGFDLLRRNIDEISKKSMPSFNRATQLVLANYGKRFQIFQNRLKNFFTQDIGQDFLGALAALTGGFENLLTIMKFVANTVVAAIAPAIVLAMATITKSIITAHKAALLLKGTMLTTGNVLVLVAIAATLVIAAVRKSKSHAERLVDSLKKLNQIASDVSNTFQTNIIDVLDDVSDKFSEVAALLAGGLATSAAFNISALSEAIEASEGLFDDLGEVFGEAFENAEDIINQILDDWQDTVNNIRDTIKQIGKEFTDVTTRASDRELEFKLNAADPANQLKILGDEFKRLETALADPDLGIDAFEDLQKRLEKILDRINKTELKGLREEQKAVNKLIAERIKLEEKRKKIIERGRKAERPGITSAGNAKTVNIQKVRELQQELVDIRRQIRGVEAELANARVGGQRIGIRSSQEDVDRIVEQAQNRLSEAGIKSSNAARDAAQQYLNVLLKISEEQLKNSEATLAAEQLRADSFEKLQKAIEDIDIEDLFAATGPDAVEKSKKALEQLITNLRKFAQHQDDLGFNSEGARARAKATKLEANAEANIDKQLQRVKNAALQTALKELEIQKEIQKNKLKGLSDEIARREIIRKQVETLLKTVGTSESGSAIHFVRNEILRNLIGSRSGDAIQGEKDVSQLTGISDLLDLFSSTGTDKARQDLIAALIKLTERFNLGEIAPEIVKEGERVKGKTDPSGVARFQTTKDTAEIFQQFIRDLRDEGFGKTGAGEEVTATKDLEEQLRKGQKRFEDLVKEGNAHLEELRKSGIIQVRTFDEATDDFTTAVNNFGEATRELAKVVEKANFVGPIEKHHGGLIPGSGNGDTVPALLTPGEFVVNKQSTGKFINKLIGINRDRSPQKFADGGRVDVGGINVNVNGSKSPQATAKAVAAEINRGIRQGTIQLRR